MGTHADNDDFDPWSSIGLAALMILNRLQCKARLLELQKENAENSDDEAKRRDERERYIQQRSAEIRRFEEIAKGIVPNASRRKRKAD